jgi:uncharacterized protein YecT (DUF1311 family)
MRHISFDRATHGLKLPVAAMMLVAVGWSAGTEPARALDCRNGSQMDLTQCADQDARQADTALNEVYRSLMVKLDAANQTRLRDAQRAWVAFRDKECVFRTGGGTGQEGTIWPMLMLKCDTELTTARTRELRAQLKCQSWDLSCPAD